MRRPARDVEIGVGDGGVAGLVTGNEGAIVAGVIGQGPESLAFSFDGTG